MKPILIINVPSDVNRGTQTVKITGTDPDLADDEVSAASATASLTVGVLALTAQPAMVVPGQQITIQGSGFVAGDNFDSVTVGGISVPLSPQSSVFRRRHRNHHQRPQPRDPARLWHWLRDKDYRGELSHRLQPRGRGEIEIPEAAITLSPENSRRGTTVNVSGSGFPSGDLVQVQYDNSGSSVTVAAGSADASGAVSINFTVPSYARISAAEHDVRGHLGGRLCDGNGRGHSRDPGRNDNAERQPDSVRRATHHLRR